MVAGCEKICHVLRWVGEGQLPRMSKFIKRFSALIVFVGLAACTDTGGTGVAASDPYENINRKVHAFNKAVDANLVGPVAEVYGETVHEEIRQSLHNGARNLDQPSVFVNHILQGDIDDAARTFFRFSLNSTFGLAGLRDPASDAGLYARDTGFGETLAAWGIREGAYLELPLLGPSSERDAAGRVVDYVINPIQYVVSPDTRRIIVASNVFRINDRYEYRDLINAVYYQSADSYMAARIAYLQNKALKVNDGIDEDNLVDPNADF